MGYTISDDGEQYYFSYATEEEAIARGMKEFADKEEFYVGEDYEPDVEFLHEESIAEEIIDKIKHDLCDEYGEAALDFEVEAEKYYKLAESIKAAVDKWIKDERIKAGFYVVEYGKRIRIPKFIRQQ